jgi:hypothetical protein
MKQDWHPEELALHWTLSESELELLGTKTGATRLSFAILLKAFQFDGRFPDRREDVAGGIVAHLASQTGVPQEAYFEGERSERTQRYQRALIREHCGFRAFRAQDESSLIAWVSERVTSPDPEMEALKIAAYEHLRSQHVEPPETERSLRLLRTAVGRCEERIVAEVLARLLPATRVALDEIVITQASDDSDQLLLFPVRSELAAIKDGTGAVKVETVLDEIAKLKQLRALGLPEALFGPVKTFVSPGAK